MTLMTTKDFLDANISDESLDSIKFSEPCFEDEDVPILAWLIGNESTSYEVPEGSIYEDEKVNILLCTYLFPRYWDWSVDVSNIVTRLCNIIRRTYEQYTILIDIFSNELDNLMNPIKSVIKYNDTPQGENTGHTFESDDYLSNVTQSESDGGTKIARIKELENNIADYYEKWADEFKELFIYEQDC